MKALSTFIFLLTISCTFGQDQESDFEKIIIQEGLGQIVESKVFQHEYSPRIDYLLMYNNSLDVDYFENDSLILLNQRKDGKLLFSSYFFNYNDTLTINGSFGIFNAFGFSIKIVGGKAAVYHTLISPEYPTYSINENDSLELKLEVPCTNTKLTLSKIPKFKTGEVVYGIVEFESGNYYQIRPTPQDIISQIIDTETAVYCYTTYYADSPTAEGKVLRKVRMNMKVYFKAMFLDFEK